MKRFKRLFSGTSAAVLTLSSLLSVGFTGVAHAAVQTCDWIGGTDLLFSTAANWSNCGGGSPLVGDIIRLDNASVPAAPASGTAPTVLTNDLNVALGGVETYYSVTSGNYQVVINTLKLADGGYFEATTAPSLNSKLNLVVGTVANGSIYTTLGSITTMGSVDIKTNGLQYSNMNVWSNSTITLGDGVSASSYNLSLNASGVTLALQKGSSFYVYPSQVSNNNIYNVLVGGGSGTDLPQLNVYDYSTYDSTTQKSTYPGTEVVFSGALTLNSDLDVEAGYNTLTTVKFTGAVSGSGAITRNENSVGKLITTSGELTNPVKTTSLDGDITGQVAGAWLTVNQNETAILNGARSGITVQPAGTLKGTGTLTDSLNVNDGGHVAPGNSPGCLTVGTLTLSGEYQFELGGADPCTGYDQIKVTDTTSAKSTILDATTAVLTTSRFNDYTPKQGQVFTIIDNQGPNPVDGTFKDLAEGATFEQNGVVFKISYIGGTGNDVTITVQNVPTAPDTGFALVAANPIVGLSLMAAAAGALMIMARRFRPAHAVAHKTTRRRK